VKLTTHLEFKKAWSYISTPTPRLHGVVLNEVQGQLYLYLTLPVCVCVSLVR
jgi:hypothetical protein